MSDPVKEGLAKGFGSGCGCMLAGAVVLILAVVLLLGGCGAFLHSLFQ
jgi:hypothetical protein